MLVDNKALLALSLARDEAVPISFHVAPTVPSAICSDATLLWRCLLNFVTNALNKTVRGAAGARRNEPPRAAMQTTPRHAREGTIEASFARAGA